jgi:hypothetical protein
MFISKYPCMDELHKGVENARIKCPAKEQEVLLPWLLLARLFL